MAKAYNRSIWKTSSIRSSPPSRKASGLGLAIVVENCRRASGPHQRIQRTRRRHYIRDDAAASAARPKLCRPDEFWLSKTKTSFVAWFSCSWNRPASKWMARRLPNRRLPLATVANLIITDLRLPGMDGLQFIQQLQARGIQAAVIVITAHGSVETAVEAMKLGAADFLQKPFSLDHLTTVVQKVMAVQSLRAENQRLREELDQRYQFDNIIGAKRRHARDLSYCGARCANPSNGFAGRRKRRRQGHDRARDPPALAAQESPVRENQLHGASRKSDGKRAVRVREGRVYRSERQQAGQIRASRSRNRFSRRNRRRARKYPGEAAADSPGTAV